MQVKNIIASILQSTEFVCGWTGMTFIFSTFSSVWNDAHICCFAIIFIGVKIYCRNNRFHHYKTIIGATFSYISFFRTTLLVHGFFRLLASSKLYKFSFGDSPFRSEFLPVSSKIIPFSFLGMLCNFFLTASSFIVSCLFSTKKERFFLSHAASYNTVMVVISSKTFLAANQPNYYHFLLFYYFGLLLFAVFYQSDSFFFCIFTI